MRLAAIVVSFNQREATLACLRSLRREAAGIAGGMEIVLVDNASSDGTAEAVRCGMPGVGVAEMPANVGFAAAVAAGLKRTTADWLLLLNNDAEVGPGALERLLSHTGDDPQVGILAPTMLFADGSGRINSAGLTVDRLGVAADRLLGAPAAAAGTATTDVFGASGGAALLRREMLDDVGGIDATFFMYMEDVDLAWRAQAHGWRALHVPEAEVWHAHSLSAQHGSDMKLYHVGLGRVRLLAKNASTRHLIRYGPAIIAYDSAYVLWVACTRRTLAPLRGRLRGLREWRRYRQAGGGTRLDSARLARPLGARSALRRHRVWQTRTAGGASVRPAAGDDRGDRHQQHAEVTPE